MPLELLQFAGVLAVIAVIALLWYVFVYKPRRTGEGDGTPREKHPRHDEQPTEGDEEER